MDLFQRIRLPLPMTRQFHAAVFCSALAAEGCAVSSPIPPELVDPRGVAIPLSEVPSPVFKILQDRFRGDAIRRVERLDKDRGYRVETESGSIRRFDRRGAEYGGII